jgi:protein-arginine kinase activator protein McsA
VKETGQSMRHYIIPDGRYAKAYAKLVAQGFQLHWQFVPVDQQARAKKSSKTKFTCPECGLNAWAKPGAHLICGECYNKGQGDICLMVAVSWGATGEPAHAGKVAFRSAS